MSSGMSLDRVEWHLWNWEQHQRPGRADGGYRNKASGGIEGGGSDDFDEMVSRADARCAEIVDAAIDDLPLLERVSVHHVHLASVFRFERADVALHYSIAKLMLARVLPAKGIE